MKRLAFALLLLVGASLLILGCVITGGAWEPVRIDCSLTGSHSSSGSCTFENIGNRDISPSSTVCAYPVLYGAGMNGKREDGSYLPVYYVILGQTDLCVNGMKAGESVNQTFNFPSTNEYSNFVLDYQKMGSGFSSG
jgi:hypothetical protein